MKIIDYFLLRLFLKMFFGAFTVLVTLFELITFFDLIGDFVRHKAPAGLVVLYFILKLPEAALNMAPMAVLIGAILTFSLISRSREVIIMMSSGLSVWRIATPVLLASLAISILTFLNGEYLLPITWKESKHIFDYQIRHKKAKSFIRQNMIWIKTDEGAIWNVNFFDVKTGRLHDLVVMNFTPGRERFSSIIKTRIAYLENGGWVFKDGYEIKLDAEGNFTEEKFKERRVVSSIRLEELKEVEKIPQEMNFREIRQYVKKIRNAGYDDTRYRVDMYMKITLPLVCLVMAFLSIPFSIKTSGSTGVLLSITIGAFLGFVFWFCFSMGISLGHNGNLPPLLAASGAHVVFTAYAFFKTIQLYGTLPHRLSQLFKFSRA